MIQAMNDLDRYRPPSDSPIPSGRRLIARLEKPWRALSRFWKVVVVTTLAPIFGIVAVIATSDASDYFFPEYLTAPREEQLRAALIAALHPGIPRLHEGEFVDSAVVPTIQVRVVTQMSSRKRWVLSVDYPQLTVSSPLMIDRLQHTLGSSLGVDRAPRWWSWGYSHKPRCVQVLVNGEEILFGAEGFRISGAHFCSPPDQEQVELSACRLADSEAMKMQRILKELEYYGGPVYQGFVVDPVRHSCSHDWEKHVEVVDALKRFQTDQKLPVDGRFGRNTRVCLRKAAEAHGLEL